MNQTNPRPGMWRSKNMLYFDPMVAQFDNRCIFTNQPGASFHELKLTNVSVDDQGFTMSVQKQEFPYSLPVSDAWIQSRAAKSKWIGRVILIVGAVSLLLAVLSGILSASLDLGEEIKMPLIATTGGLGVTGLIVGLAWPFLKDVNGTQGIFIIQGCQFEDECIGVSQCSPEFLDGLPEWQVS